MNIRHALSDVRSNEILERQKYKLPENDTAGKTNKAQADSISISAEAARMQMEEKAADYRLFREQIANAESLEKYKVEDLTKLELRASSVFGGDNLFQGHSEHQYEVFDKWLEEHADTLPEEILSRIRDGVKNATDAMDKLNALGGYRGTSFESVALLESSRFALENIKNTIVPENLRSGFGQLVEEYVRFNEEARDRIMERMTPEYMVEDIGKSTQYNRPKEELLSSQRSFYSREKEEIKAFLREYYSEASDKAKVKTKLQQYTERYHKKDNPMYADNRLFEKGFVSMMLP